MWANRCPCGDETHVERMIFECALWRHWDQFSAKHSFCQQARAAPLQHQHSTTAVEDFRTAPPREEGGVQEVVGMGWREGCGKKNEHRIDIEHFRTKFISETGFRELSEKIFLTRAPLPPARHKFFCWFLLFPLPPPSPWLTSMLFGTSEPS
jgi:hypothetical protein